MNLLHINDSLERGGAETLLVNTVQAIEKYYPDTKQTVVTLYDRGNLREDIMDTADYYSLGFRLNNPFPALSRLKKIIAANRIDVVHSHLLHSTLLSRLAVRSGIKLVSTYHSVFYEPSMVSFAKKELWLDRLTYKNRFFSIFVSQAVRDNIMNAVGIKENYEVLPNFVSSKFYPTYQFRDLQTLKIVMIGNLHEIKNHEIAIRAVAALSHLPISIDIYGEGSLRSYLEALIYETGANVNLKGRVIMNSQILSDYDLFLMTSHHEGMPLSVIEALQTGLPCLLNDISMLKETGGEAAIYYDYNSLDSLINSLKLLLSGKERLRELSKNAFVQARKFSAECVVKKLFAIYTDV